MVPGCEAFVESTLAASVARLLRAERMLDRAPESQTADRVYARIEIRLAREQLEAVMSMTKAQVVNDFLAQKAIR